MDFWWIRKKDQLKELIVDSNQLTDECDYPYLQSLMHLSISNNQICDLDRLMDKDGFARKYIFIQILPSKTNILVNQIKLQTSFPRLQYLNINGNPVCPLLINQYESYCMMSRDPTELDETHHGRQCREVHLNFRKEDMRLKRTIVESIPRIKVVNHKTVGTNQHVIKSRIPISYRSWVFS